MIKKINIVCLALILFCSYSLSCFADVSDDFYIVDNEKVDFDAKSMGNDINDNKLSNKKEILINKLSDISVEKRNVSSKAAGSNTTPNAAIQIAQFATGYNGTMDTVNEQRWYALVTSEKMKLSFNVDVTDLADFDLYMYKLNEQTMSLEFVTGKSFAQGEDVELYSIQDAGTYYLMLHNSQGSGDFSIKVYGSNQDMDMEINDSLATAYSVSNIESGLSGVIDNPKDFENAESETYAGFIKSSAQNTLVLLDDLLNWAKSQTGQITFNPKKICWSSLSAK